jgi:hypothetical protein
MRLVRFIDHRVVVKFSLLGVGGPGFTNPKNSLNAIILSSFGLRFKDDRTAGLAQALRERHGAKEHRPEWPITCGFCQGYVPLSFRHSPQ